ncbi:uncharacterized protein FIBRA_06276 [Fibroporia radiculosa]|uniref:DUF202 domain-containing protein n=1 Tax=Fibroporia radiculosa TaxID=599839 RepID=J4IB64_9APHY|nr:uncharacterized protein FIBRA_06276 [Fibroporia radiculosa]CCM04116.1 predicted protein [Fibroporia radiculosa]
MISRTLFPQNHHHQHYYRGHRADTFIPNDVNELVEIRARQRTFNGAYERSALSNLGYAVAILRLFDKRFTQISIAYTLLAGLLYILAYFRQRRSRHDFADQYRYETYIHAIPTVGQTGKTNFGRPFITAGWIVMAVSVAVALVEIGLLWLILTIELSPDSDFY